MGTVFVLCGAVYLGVEFSKMNSIVSGNAKERQKYIAISSAVNGLGNFNMGGGGSGEFLVEENVQKFCGIA